MPDQPRCDACRFWARHPGDALASEADDVSGTCRRFPPVLNNTIVAISAEEDSVQAAEDANREMSSWAWPVTCGCDWCGEFQPKPEAIPRSSLTIRQWLRLNNQSAAGDNERAVEITIGLLRQGYNREEILRIRKIRSSSTRRVMQVDLAIRYYQEQPSAKD